MLPSGLTSCTCTGGKKEGVYYKGRVVRVLQQLPEYGASREQLDSYDPWEAIQVCSVLGVLGLASNSLAAWMPALLCCSSCLSTGPLVSS